MTAHTRAKQYESAFLFAVAVYMSSEIAASIMQGNKRDIWAVTALELLAPTISLIAGLLLIRAGIITQTDKPIKEGLIYSILSMSMLFVRVQHPDDDCEQTQAPVGTMPLWIIGGGTVIFSVTVYMIEKIK